MIPNSRSDIIARVSRVKGTCRLTISDSLSRSYVHAVPDLYALAYIDTDTCAYGHGSAYSDTDGDCANTDTGAGSYGSAYADAYSRASANGGPVNTDTGAYCHSDTDAYTYGCSAYGDTGANRYGSTGAYQYHHYPGWTSNQRCCDECRNWDICNHGCRRIGPCKLPRLNRG